MKKGGAYCSPHWLLEMPYFSISISVYLVRSGVKNVSHGNMLTSHQRKDERVGTFFLPDWMTPGLLKRHTSLKGNDG